MQGSRTPSGRQVGRRFAWGYFAGVLAGEAAAGGFWPGWIVALARDET